MKKTRPALRVVPGRKNDDTTKEDLLEIEALAKSGESFSVPDGASTCKHCGAPVEEGETRCDRPFCQVDI